MAVRGEGVQCRAKALGATPDFGGKAGAKEGEGVPRSPAGGPGRGGGGGGRGRVGALTAALAQREVQADAVRRAMEVHRAKAELVRRPPGP